MLKAAKKLKRPPAMARAKTDQSWQSRPTAISVGLLHFKVWK